LWKSFRCYDDPLPWWLLKMYVYGRWHIACPLSFEVRGERGHALPKVLWFCRGTAVGFPRISSSRTKRSLLERCHPKRNFLNISQREIASESMMLSRHPAIGITWYQDKFYS
jgi:hypothetical protein